MRFVQLVSEEVGDHGRALFAGLRVRGHDLLAVDVSLDRQRQVLEVVHLFFVNGGCGCPEQPTVQRG